MKTGPCRTRSRVKGYTLPLTLTLGVITLGIVASTLRWTTNNIRLNARNMEYFRTVAAAEAGTEAVISRLTSDYQSGGDALVQNNLESYREVIPTAAEDIHWAQYVFADDLGHLGKTQIVFVPPSEFRELASQYHGLRGYASAYRILSAARQGQSGFAVRAAVEQNVETATIPLFQFAIFYNMDLELNPGATMTITGPVHSNGIGYFQPQATLTFEGDVTAAGLLIHGKKPGDPTSRTPGTIVYGKEHDGGVSTLALPIGTNNSPAAVRQVVEIPSVWEDRDSPMGRQRYYNQADIVIKVTNGGIVASSGASDNFATVIPSAQVSQFVDTSVTFYNAREQRTVKTTQIDVTKLNRWNSTNTVLRPRLPTGDIQIVYVDDQRSQTSSTEPGVRLVNGQTVLPRGLTVVTPDPLYVLGHYNAPASALGTPDTSNTRPAALVGDAITILSPNWNDSKSTRGLSERVASDTTVNAALLAGIVSTVSGSYSGGAENFPRFLEDWSNKVFTYNGSMVVMFESEFATGLWRGTGSSIGIYNPPNRRWAFDTNFRNPAKLPPGTPAARVLVRANWAAVTPQLPF